MKPYLPIVAVFAVLLADQDAAQRTSGAARAPSKVCFGPPSWHDLNGGVPSGPVQAVGFFGPPSSRELIVGGSFTYAGGVGASNVASWDGQEWHDLDGGVSGSLYGYWGPFVDAVERFGGRLVVGGAFSAAGVAPANNIAAWEPGSGWSDLDGGLWGGLSSMGYGEFPRVVDMEVFDDGTGESLYAVGDFTWAGGGVPVMGFARWSGTSWSDGGAPQPPSGGGADGWGYRMTSIAVFDDGSAPVLVVAGGFTEIGGVPAQYIAAWNGSTWSPLGAGVNDEVYDMVQFDDGNGPALYVGGSFSRAGGVPMDHVARWDGSSWSSVPGFDSSVFALVVHDDGSGKALYAGGPFDFAGGLFVAGLARWDGSQWSAIDGWHGDLVYDLASTRGHLAVGGYISQAGGIAVGNVALWGCGLF